MAKLIYRQKGEGVISPVLLITYIVQLLSDWQQWHYSTIGGSWA